MVDSASYSRNRNWWCDSETSSVTQSDNRYAWEDEVTSQGELFYVRNFPTSNESEVPQSSLTCDNSEETTSTGGILNRLIRRRNSRRSLRRKESVKESAGSSSAPISSYLVRNESTQIKDPQPQTMDDSVESIDVNATIDFSCSSNFGRRATFLESYLGLKTTYHGAQIIITGFVPNSPHHHIHTNFQIGDWLFSINDMVVNSENIDNYLWSLSLSKEFRQVILNIKRLRSSNGAKSEIQHSSNSDLDDGLDSSIFDDFSVVYVKLSRLSDSSSVSEDITFCYPQEANVLTPVRGAFLTLLHLLPSIVKHKPLSTTIKTKKHLLHVMYTQVDDEVLLLALPDSSLIDRIFLDQCRYRKMFAVYFSNLIQVQVDDALNELESNDIDSYDEQRLYNIVGSAYFYKGYLVCSHLSKEDLLDLVSLIRQSDLLRLMRTGVQDLIFWREVYPSSAKRGLHPKVVAPYTLLAGRWFLLIVAKDHNFLFVLLESGGCTMKAEQKPGPDIAYVEEAQATVLHLIKIGTPKVADKLLRVNVATKLSPSHPPQSLSSADSTTLASSSCESSLSKQYSLSYRSLDSTMLPRSRANINLISGCDSVSSEEWTPVIGRRAERELVQESLSRASDFSDESDWSKDPSRGPSDLPDVESNMSKVTTGNEDLMLHYVHLDQTEGVLLSSVNSDSSKICNLLDNFRFHAHKIHKILHNTVSFKKLKNQEVSSCALNKSLIAIKEHGILFNCSAGVDKEESHSYWVVGRLVCSPRVREVYLCYKDSCPQNMVEVAFRLALSHSFSSPL